MIDTIHALLVHDINVYLGAEFPGFRCFNNPEWKNIWVGAENGEHGVFPCCLFRCRLVKTGFYSYWMLTQIDMVHRINDEKIGRQKIVRLRSPPWNLFSTTRGTMIPEYVDEVEMVDTLTERECLHHILQFLHDHFLPATLTHGLK